MRWAILAFLLSWPAAASPVPSAELTTVRKADADDVPARGPRHAPVTIELYCNFIVPQCAPVHALLRQLADRHPDELRLIYRQIAPPVGDAPLFAEAAVEAWRQGCFFALADRAYALRGVVTAASLDGLFHDAGCDAAPLWPALADHRHVDVIDRDALHRDEMGLPNLLPIISWNGVSRSPPLRVESYEAQYNQALVEARRRVAEGVPVDRLYPLIEREARARRPRFDLSSLPRKRVDIGAAAAIGPADAAVTVVMFADFACPICSRELDALFKLAGSFPDRVRLVWKHMPVSYHQNARLAAEGAACAQRQGRMWRYADVLRGGAPHDSHAALCAAANLAGLDVARFSDDLEHGRCAADVDADVAQARALGVSGSPTLFVNGIRYGSALSYPELRHILADETRPGWLEDLTVTE